VVSLAFVREMKARHMARRITREAFTLQDPEDEDGAVEHIVEILLGRKPEPPPEGAA
jgi:hypothetical protein